MNISDLQMALSNSSTVSNQNAAASGTEKSLGKDAFLKMLLAQIQYQDPLEPMENTEFTAQLAQFSSLEQLSSLNKEFSSLSSSINSQKNILFSNLVGKEVEVAGNKVNVEGGNISPVSFELKDNARSVEITISKNNGPVVRKITLGTTEAGRHDITWDGKNFENQAVPDGKYTFRVAALDKNHNSVNSTTIINGNVDGLTFKNGTPYLEISGMKVSPEYLLKIK